MNSKQHIHTYVLYFAQSLIAHQAIVYSLDSLNYLFWKFFFHVHQRNKKQSTTFFVHSISKHHFRIQKNKRKTNRFASRSFGSNVSTERIIFENFKNVLYLCWVVYGYYRVCVYASAVRAYAWTSHIRFERFVCAVLRWRAVTGAATH